MAPNHRDGRQAKKAEHLVVRRVIRSLGFKYTIPPRETAMNQLQLTSLIAYIKMSFSPRAQTPGKVYASRVLEIATLWIEFVFTDGRRRSGLSWSAHSSTRRKH